MSFGLEQEGGSLIIPMELAHPLHPINSRSRNKCWNLWVGRCVSSRWPLFLSRNFVLICIYIYTYAFFIRILVIRRINKYRGSVVQYWWSCTLSQSIGLCWGSARFLCWMPLFYFFGVTNCVFFMINKAILGCLWPLVFVLNILTLGILRSAISHLPEYFCPLTFFQNVGFNIVPSGPFMLQLPSQLGYSGGEFQALQLIVLVAFSRGLTTCLPYVCPLFGNRL